MQCPQCGTKNEKDNKYCKDCGTLLQKDLSGTSPTHKEKKSTEKKEVSLTLHDMTAAVLLCGIVGGGIPAVFLPGIGGVCCLWAGLIGGGAVLLSKYFNGIKGKISPNNALVAGALAGFIAAVIITGSASMQMQEAEIFGFEKLMKDSDSFNLNENMESKSELTDEELEELEKALDDAFDNIFPFLKVTLLLFSLFSLVVYPLFGALGGVITNEIA